MEFKKAVKYEAQLRMAIAGPSGSGKTWTSLAIAQHFGKVALVDTEHGSASKYADIYDFDTLILTPPFHPDKYMEAIANACAGGYDVVILDSLSHAWNGPGGLLEIVDGIAARMRTPNTFAAWKDATPIQNRLVQALTGPAIHVIAAMRSKQGYVSEKDEGGKTVIRKVGMEAIQRAGLEYEFDVFAEMNWENKFVVSKTRCPELAGKVFSKPTGAEIAGILQTWLSGEPAPHWIDNPKMADALKEWAEERGLSDKDILKLMGLDDIHDYAASATAFKTVLEAALVEASSAQKDIDDLYGEEKDDTLPSV